MLIETYAPYLTPVSFRGYMRYDAEKIANFKQCSVEQVMLSTTSNTKQVFK